MRGHQEGAGKCPAWDPETLKACKGEGSRPLTGMESLNPVKMIMKRRHQVAKVSTVRLRTRCLPPCSMLTVAFRVTSYQKYWWDTVRRQERPGEPRR